MNFDLNNLESLNDYTNAGTYFVNFYNPKLLYDNDAIGAAIHAIYKAKIRLDKTKSDNRFNYTKRAVFNSLIKYQQALYKKDDYKEPKIDTPLELLIKEEDWREIQTFLDGLHPMEIECANLIYDGLKKTDIAVKLNVSRSSITQIINKIREKWLIYVEQKEKSRKSRKK